MKYNNKTKITVLILLLIIFSFVIEIFVFNFKILTLNSRSKGMNYVDKYDETISNDKKIISFNFHGIYVNKLKIKYKCFEDVKANFEYVSRNYYNKKIKKNAIDIFDNEVNLQVLNIKSPVNKFNIMIDENSKLSIEKIYVDNSLKISYFRILFIFSFEILLSLIIYYYKSKKNNSVLYKYFFIVGLIMGGAFIIAQPSSTFYSWDDQIHFKNSYELFVNSFTWNIGEYSMIDDKSVGRWSISSIEEQENQMSYLSKDIETTYSTQSSRLIHYDKVAYIPSAMGYHLCKLCKLPFYISFKVGKFMNLLFYLVLMAYAIKISKYGKRIITVIGLLPTSLFLACQYSYDPAVISGITLGVVSILNWFCDDKYKINFKNISVFLFGILFACFTKAVYIPIILLFLFIPSSKFKNKKQEFWIKGIILLIFILVLSTFALPTDIVSTNIGDSRGGDTNIAEQFKNVIKHPDGYIMVLKDTAFDRFFYKFIGHYTLGYFSYIGLIKENIYFLLLCVLLFASITDNYPNQMNFRKRIACILIILFTIFLIWTALYLSFTPVGDTGINGVQNRYFIPLLFPFIIFCQINRIRTSISDYKYNTFILFCLIIAFMMSFYETVILHYCI